MVLQKNVCRFQVALMFACKVTCDLALHGSASSEAPVQPLQDEAQEIEVSK
jgi:hypothetical protein